MKSPTHDRREEDRTIWSRFRYHSRTFSLAAMLLPRPVRLPVASLYLFCRTVDEIADRLVLSEGTTVALSQLSDLQSALDHTLRGEPPDQMLWIRLAEVNDEFGLSEAPMQELIAGARWDLEGKRILNEADLVEYSNLVGGSIGAMMLPLLGLHEDAAVESRARDLGIGMQITNIIRDVGEDLHTLRRSYIPTALATQWGVDPAAPIPQEARYRAVMEHLMDLAESYYDSGLVGTSYLPRRMRSGIRSATRFYREILNEVRANEYDNLTRRAVVPGTRKAASLIAGSYERRKSRLLRRLS